MDKTPRLVTFTQYDEPPLKAGKYTVDVKQTVNQASHNTFKAITKFAVTGERFSFDPSEISGTFPQDLANGEFSGILPHVVFQRRTLPWERSSLSGRGDAPWLGILLFNEEETPQVQKRAAKDLIPQGSIITVEGSSVTALGTLPSNTLSYPGMNLLDYGESPDNPCSIIDIPIEIFNKIAPSAEDLPYLAHTRESDTIDSEDTIKGVFQCAVVLGNRVPQDNKNSHAFLVSFENLEAYLPTREGAQSAKIPRNIQYIRLITYQHWRFFANTQDQTFASLLKNLNTQKDGERQITSLQLPFLGNPPTSLQVTIAMDQQAQGRLNDDNAQVLLYNALSMGYSPLTHTLRRAGQTVSWYRGPLVPYPVAPTLSVPLSCPDAANKYDPQTGLFDVSYGAAWQLGQLLALNNREFSTSLYNWRRNKEKKDLIVSKENDFVENKLKQTPLFESIFLSRKALLHENSPLPPGPIENWIARLRLLYGIPFNYLVPDESMLPPESLRFFYMDPDWIESLVDGALSIGRMTAEEIRGDAAPHMAIFKQKTITAAKQIRLNTRPAMLYRNNDAAPHITGFLLRSQAVSGWPRLQMNGYVGSDYQSLELQKLRMERISSDILLCLFDGIAQCAYFHLPPEHLHSGVEGAAGKFTTTLRAVTGSTPGKQFLKNPKGGTPNADVPTRTDNQTLMVRAAADSIFNKLTKDFAQKFPALTSAEFALQMVKGVVKVEFQQNEEKSGS